MNRTCLNRYERAILSGYNFIGEETARQRKNCKTNDHLLCVQKNNDGTHQLGVLSRTDITFRSIVKCFFGFGKLAGVSMKLSEVADYLASRDLSQISPESSEYSTIHTIAIRCMIHGKVGDPLPSLLKKLAIKVEKYTFRHITQNTHLYWTFPERREDYDGFILKREVYRPQTKECKRDLLVTPLTTSRHLCAQAHRLTGKVYKRVERTLTSYEENVTCDPHPHEPRRKLSDHHPLYSPALLI